MRNLYLIVKEDFINLIKNPMWIFFATGFPILLVMIMGLLTKNKFGGDITSFDFYGINMMIYTLLYSGTTSANSFMEERIKKPNMRIIYAPCRDSYIYISKIIASFMFEFIFHVFDMALLTLIFGINLGSIFHLFVVLTLVELFGVTTGVMICCIVKSESTSNQILGMVINIFAIFGGLLFSLDGYGETARKISLCSPFKWISKNIFQIIYDKDYSLFIPVVLFLIVAIGIMIFVCKLTFKKEDCIC